MPVDHAKLTALFTEAMDLGPDEQRALIQRVHAEDTALAAELAEMLDADLEIVTALRTAGLKPDDVGEAFRRKTAMPPERIDIPGYTVRFTLGEGGMGVVYAARDAAGADVAIKVLHVAAREAIQRFEAEATIMKRLAHPGIARVLDSGAAGDQLYLVMELIDGLTLDVFVRKKQPSLRQRLELVIALCEAMQHAHGAGVIHRDLKPTNVMVRAQGGVAVLDFGVARIGRSSGMTQQGDVLGTPLYMSPEQALGRAGQSDARADVYSLGVMLFELVAGTPPYNIKGLPLPAAVRTISTQPPKPLGYDDTLDAIVLRALAKAPDGRFASAGELGAALGAYLGNKWP